MFESYGKNHCKASQSTSLAIFSASVRLFVCVCFFQLTEISGAAGFGPLVAATSVRSESETGQTDITINVLKRVISDEVNTKSEAVGVLQDKAGQLGNLQPRCSSLPAA